VVLFIGLFGLAKKRWINCPYPFSIIVSPLFPTASREASPPFFAFSLFCYSPFLIFPIALSCFSAFQLSAFGWFRIFSVFGIFFRAVLYI
jgi:hypothetical protein